MGLSKSEVLEWYRNADAVTRIEFVCDLLKTCLPCELRLVAVSAEELGRRDWHSLRSYEQFANSPAELRYISDLSDLRARSKLMICLCLLRSSSRACASRLFELLIDASSRLLSSSCSPPSPSQLLGCSADPAAGENQETTTPAVRPSDRPLLDDLLLLVTIAVHHPAFSVTQKFALVEQLEALKDAMAAFDLGVTGDSEGAGSRGRRTGAVSPKPADSRSAAATDANGQPSSGRSSRSGIKEPAVGGCNAAVAAAAATLPCLALQIPGEGKKGGTVSPDATGCCSNRFPAATATGFRGRGELRRSASTANCAAAPAVGSPVGGCRDSDVDSGSPGKTRNLVGGSCRNRVTGMRGRSTIADGSTSSSSPDRELPSSAGSGRHAGQGLETGCSIGTRPSRRTSRVGRQRSPSPKSCSGFTSSSADAAASSKGSRVVAEYPVNKPRSCRRPSPSSSSSCNYSDSGDSGGCGGSMFDTCEWTSLQAEPSTNAEPMLPASASLPAMPRIGDAEVSPAGVSTVAFSEPEATLSPSAVATCCDCDSCPSTAASSEGLETGPLCEGKHSCAVKNSVSDTVGITSVAPMSTGDMPSVAACESATAPDAPVDGHEDGCVEPRSWRSTQPSGGVSVATAGDESGDIVVATPVTLPPVTSTARSRRDELGLPLDEFYLRESSETLSDPVALSPSAELATSASSGSEEHAYAGSSSDSCVTPYAAVTGDYSAVGGSAAISGPLVAAALAAPLSLPPAHAGYAMPHHGPGGFVPGYGGMMYCYPMPLYYRAPPTRGRRGRAGNGGGSNVGANASAGHDLYYHPPMPPCVVMPSPLYCPVPPAMLPSQLGGDVLTTVAGGCEPAAAKSHGTSQWAAVPIAAGGPRRVDSCYSCGYSGHTGDHCPLQQQQQQTSPRLATLGGFGLDLSAV